VLSRAVLQRWEVTAEPAGLEREAVRWRGRGGLAGRAVALRRLEAGLRAGAYPRLLELGGKVLGPDPVDRSR
jgi:hypothetical protein